MRTNVYVDGFNLYYGALEGTPYRWLDLAALCRRILPRDIIHRIRYFTARVTARPDDPEQPIRQQVEKSSDVNLATHLLHDAYCNDYELAIVISNDSDLVEPIRIVRHAILDDAHGTFQKPPGW